MTRREVVAAGGAVLLLVVLAVLLAPGHVLGGSSLVLPGSTVLGALVASAAVVGALRAVAVLAVLFLAASVGVRVARGQWVSKVGAAEVEATSTAQELAGELDTSGRVLDELAARLGGVPHTGEQEHDREEGSRGGT